MSSPDHYPNNHGLTPLERTVIYVLTTIATILSTIAIIIHGAAGH